MRDVLLSGKESFKVEVPYKLIESGEPNEIKPMLVYLHPFGSHIKQFEEDCQELLNVKAYHLFIQGPYPLVDTSKNKNVSDWGRSWLLSDGNRGQHIKTLEISSEFIQQMVDKLQKLIHVGRLGIIGFDMGATLAAYFAFTRWKHVSDLAVYNGQLMVNLLNDQYERISHMNIHAVENSVDNPDAVKSHNKIDNGYSSEKAIEILHNHGVSATFSALNSSGKSTSQVTDSLKKWLLSQGYVHC